jgi:hypothetical protein
VQGECTFGDVRCSGNDIQFCTVDQKWVTQQTCPSGCNPETKSCFEVTAPAPAPTAPILPIIVIIIAIIAIAGAAYLKFVRK